MPSEIQTPGGQEPKRSVKISMGKKLLQSDRNVSQMCYESFVLNGVQYCRPHLLLTCHLCGVSNEHLQEECDFEREALGLGYGGDPGLNRRAYQWAERITEGQMEGQLKNDLLRQQFGSNYNQTHPQKWNELKKELQTKERQLNDEFLADVAKAFEEGASQCCYWACAEPAGEGKLFRCAGCGVAKYCSKDHQTKDWKWEHKLECTKNVPQFILEGIETDRRRNLGGDYEKAEYVG